MPVINEREFIAKHQMLSLQVARLPILRSGYLEARKMVEEGRLWNAQNQRDEYVNCVRWIKDIVGEM